MDDIFYEESVRWYKRVKPDGYNYQYRIGYSPSAKCYVAISAVHPRFCFKADSKERAAKIAEAALDFYDQFGIPQYEPSERQ